MNKKVFVFDPELIINRHLYEEIQEEIICPICTEILLEPMGCQCSAIFCNRCIKMLNTCPVCRAPKNFTKAMASVKVLDHLYFKCINHLKGCKHTSTYSNYIPHISKCLKCTYCAGDHTEIECLETTINSIISWVTKVLTNVNKHSIEISKYLQSHNKKEYILKGDIEEYNSVNELYSVKGNGFTFSSNHSVSFDGKGNEDFGFLKIARGVSKENDSFAVKLTQMDKNSNVIMGLFDLENINKIDANSIYYKYDGSGYSSLVNDHLMYWQAGVNDIIKIIIDYESGYVKFTVNGNIIAKSSSNKYKFVKMYFGLAFINKQIKLNLLID